MLVVSIISYSGYATGGILIPYSQLVANLLGQRVSGTPSGHDRTRLMIPDYTQHAMAPYLRWAGSNSTADAEEKSSQFGIQGHTGRFLGVWYGDGILQSRVS